MVIGPLVAAHGLLVPVVPAVVPLLASALGHRRPLASIRTLAVGIARPINDPIASIMAASETEGRGDGQPLPWPAGPP